MQKSFLSGKSFFILITAFLVVTAILLSILVTSGCAKQPQTTNPTTTLSTSHTIPNDQQQNLLKGISLSPKSYAKDDFLDFMEKTKQTGKIVTWAGDWNELANENSAPKTLMTLAPQYGYTPIILVQFFSQDSGKLLRPLNDENKQKYKDNIVQFAQKYSPQYLVIGVEVNILAAKSPQDFEDFVSFYNDVYDAIKAKSPDTKVFTNFNLEYMKGLQGGLFGRTNDASKSQWSLMDRFKSDMASFSTYPFLIYHSPSDIPSDYYSEISQHTSKPIAFTEIGWDSDASIKGWESSEENQAEFIKDFFSQTKEMDVKIAVWSFMYDQNVASPFNHLGIIGSNGTKKLAWESWTK